MTLPYERTQAVKNTREFLREIMLGKAKDFRNFTELRRRARWLLKHFPADYELDQAAEQAPDLFAKSACEWMEKTFGKKINEGVPTDG